MSKRMYLLTYLKNWIIRKLYTFKKKEEFHSFFYVNEEIYGGKIQKMFVF